MTEIRHDPLRRRRIVVAEDRAGRPNEYRRPGGEGFLPRDCPFCPGNEHETPPELAADRPPGARPNDASWTARVVPNRYPAVLPAAESSESGPPFRAGAAAGAHEVLIESRDHGATLETLPHAQVVRWLEHLQARALFHGERGARQVLVFRNCGAFSGASLSHPHTQLLALAEPTSGFSEEVASIADRFAESGRCLVCELLAAEVAAGERVVRVADGLIAVVPFAARFGGEVWIAPLGHPVPFPRIDRAALGALASLLQDVVARMLAAFGGPSWNLTFTAHADRLPGGLEHHWRLEVIPRLATIGGFELAAGDYIVSRSAEDAARALR